MRIWKIAVLMFVLTSATEAQYTSPAADFFVHGRFYDTFLRDYLRFEEPRPLRIEYWYVNWLDSSENADQYGDRLLLEGLFPIYTGRKLIVDIPFQYSRAPVWAENEKTTFGRGINVLQPHLMARWKISNRLKSIVGWEYNLKGDGEDFGSSNGRQICFLKAFFSYDVLAQLSFVAGARLDRYYYDTREESGKFELARRLYCRPAIMLNWHPTDDLIVLLGVPGQAVHLALGQVLKLEARVSIEKEVEIAMRVRPVERLSILLRLLNTPCEEVPIEGRSFNDAGVQGAVSLAERLSYTDKAVILEVGRELNPAAVASLGFRYGRVDNVQLKGESNEDVIEELDGKPHFAVGITFTVDLEALVGGVR